LRNRYPGFGLCHAPAAQPALSGRSARPNHNRAGRVLHMPVRPNSGLPMSATAAPTWQICSSCTAACASSTATTSAAASVTAAGPF
jgi:hypothetical protein